MNVALYFDMHVRRAGMEGLQLRVQALPHRQCVCYPRFLGGYEYARGSIAATVCGTAA